MVTSVIDILIANAGVQTLVGMNQGGTKYKVYPIIVPEKEKHPYIVVRQTSKARAGKDCGFASSVSVTSYHKTYDGVVALDSAVLVALENDDGKTLESTIDGWAQADGDGLYSRTSTFTGFES